jgi:hypothetical protein
VIPMPAIKDLQDHKVIPSGHDGPIIMIESSYCDNCQDSMLSLLQECLGRSADTKYPPTKPARTTLRTHLRAMYNAHLIGKLPSHGYGDLLDLAAQGCIHLVPEEEFGVWIDEGCFDEYLIRDLRSAIGISRE